MPAMGSGAHRRRRPRHRAASRRSDGRSSGCAASPCARLPLQRHDPHGRPGRRGRAPPPPRPHQVRGLRRAPARGLHGQVRAPRRAAALALQPRAGGHAAGVPARLSRPEAARRRAPLPSVARGGVDLLEAARQRPAVVGHPAGRHRAAGAHGRGAPHPRPLLAGERVRDREDGAITACGSRPRTRSSTSPTSATCGCWPTSTRPTWPSVRLGMAAELSRRLPAGTELEGPRHLGLAHRRGEDAHRQGARRGGQPAGALKPEMFADVVLQTEPGPGPGGPGERACVQAGERPARVRRPRRGTARAARGAASARKVTDGIEVLRGARRGRPRGGRRPTSCSTPSRA